MANVSRVLYGNEVLMDLTNDTITPNVLLAGVTAHDRSGNLIVGSLNLGNLAYRNYIEYSSDLLTNKPDFHKLAFQDFIDYNSDQLRNKPVFRLFAFQDDLDYQSDQLKNKPMPLNTVMDNLLEVYPDLPRGFQLVTYVSSEVLKVDEPLLYYSDETAIVNDELDQNQIIFRMLDDFEILSIEVKEKFFDYVTIDYNSDQLINKPEPVNRIMDRILELYPELPQSIVIAVYASEGITFLDNNLAQYDDEIVSVLDETVNGIRLDYEDEDQLDILVVENWFSESNVKNLINARIEDAPMDGKRYVRQNGQWVELT